MNPVLPVSACLISGAEVHRIGRALDSVVELASEIVVVLNEEVRDGTEELCVQRGAKVFRHPWGGFREQKNLAQSYATQPWIFQLDADEELSPGLKSELRDFFSTDPQPFAGAFCPRKVWFMGRWITHGDWYPDRVLRLYRRDAGRWAGSPEHCAVELSGPTTRLRHDLFHYSNPTVASYVHKIPYYSELYLQRQLAAGARWSAPPVIVRSIWRFLRAYVLRGGFLDGYPGFFIAASTAYATLARHTRLYEHLHSAPPPCPPSASH